MANRRKRKMAEAVDDDAEMEMTPMIDVTFLLLIFFMCTIKFKTLEGKLSAYLPKDRGNNPDPVEPIETIEVKMLVVNEGTKYNATVSGEPGAPWDGSSRFVHGPDRKITYQIGPKPLATLQEVGRDLTAKFKATPENPVTIDPRKGIVYADVVHVLDKAIQAGFTDISFAGSYEK